MKNFISNTKMLRFSGFKASPTAPTDEQVVKINQFTRRPFKADELYIGQLWLANNGIDRDNERFNEEILQHYNRTIIRKTFLLDHGKYDIQDKAMGKFFDSVIDTVTLEEAIRITGEEIELPPGVTDVLFLAPWFYIPRAGVDEKTIVKIDAAVYDFSSLGFRAERFVPITDQKGTVLYYEYQGRGEATEGSLVYLGAQHGAGVKSAEEEGKSSKGAPGAPQDSTRKPNQGGIEKMKNLVMKLMRTFNKAFSEDEDKLHDELKAFIDEKDARIAALTSEAKTKDEKILELTPLADVGKAYKETLVGAYVAARAKLGEVSEKVEDQKAMKDTAAGFRIGWLQSEVKSLEARVAEKFPAEAQTHGDDRRDKSSDAGGEKSWKKKNPLVPEEA